MVIRFDRHTNTFHSFYINYWNDSAKRLRFVEKKMDLKLGNSNHQWGFIGGQLGDVNYPEYLDAEAKYIVVTERDNHRMQVFDNCGNVSNFKICGSKGKGYNELCRPAGVITTPVQNCEIVVADSGNKRVNYYGLRTDLRGYGEINQLSSFGTLIFEKPMSVAYDERNNTVIVGDPGRRRLTYHDFINQQLIRVVDQRNSRIPLQAPYDIVVDRFGRSFVSDHESSAIFCFEGNGKHLFTFGQKELSSPWGLCFDRKKEFLYVSDYGNDRVLKYSQDGVFLKEVGKFMRPKGLTVNVHGNLVVATEDPLYFIKLIGFNYLEDSSDRKD